MEFQNARPLLQPQIKRKLCGKICRLWYLLTIYTVCIWPDSEPAKLLDHLKQKPQPDKHLPQPLKVNFLEFGIASYQSNLSMSCIVYRPVSPVLGLEVLMGVPVRVLYTDLWALSWAWRSWWGFQSESCRYRPVGPVLGLEVLMGVPVRVLYTDLWALSWAWRSWCGFQSESCIPTCEPCPGPGGPDGGSSRSRRWRQCPPSGGWVRGRPPAWTAGRWSSRSRPCWTGPTCRRGPRTLSSRPTWAKGGKQSFFLPCLSIKHLCITID